MAATARMRFIHQAVEELKQEDPGTQITVHYLRKLVKTGVIPSVKIGNNRRLINYDLLLEYLAKPYEERRDSGVIRRVM